MVTHLNVFCSLWGTKYSTDYVDRLYSMVERNCPVSFDFFCQTDLSGFRKEVNVIPFLTDLPNSTPKEMWNSPDFMHGLPRLWDRPKLNYWKPNGWGITGTKIAFDVDIIIQNDLTSILETHSDKPITGRSWWHNMIHEGLPQWRRRYGARTNGGFYMWNDQQGKPIWGDLLKHSKFIYFCFHGGSDNFITTRHWDKFEFLSSEQIYSFNRGCEWPDDIEPFTLRPDKTICVFNTDVGDPTHLELHEASEKFLWIKDYWK